MIASNIFNYFVIFILTFATIRGESCNRFRRCENIMVERNTCRMETSWLPDLVSHCVDECYKDFKVRPLCFDKLHTTKKLEYIRLMALEYPTKILYEFSHVLLNLNFRCGQFQWRIQDFLMGRNSKWGGRRPNIWPNFTKNRMKMNKIRPWGWGGGILCLCRSAIF